MYMFIEFISMVNSCHFIHSVDLRPGDLHHGRIRTVWKVANVTLGGGGGGMMQVYKQSYMYVHNYSTMLASFLGSCGGGSRLYRQLHIQHKTVSFFKVFVYGCVWGRWIEAFPRIL